VKVGCGVGCATAVDESAAKSSNAAGPRLASSLGIDPREAATLPVRTIMGASIAEPRADDGRPDSVSATAGKRSKTAANCDSSTLGGKPSAVSASLSNFPWLA
jgi:hypothetical protein